MPSLLVCIWHENRYGNRPKLGLVLYEYIYAHAIDIKISRTGKVNQITMFKLMLYVPVNNFSDLSRLSYVEPVMNNESTLSCSKTP